MSLNVKECVNTGKSNEEELQSQIQASETKISLRNYQIRAVKAAIESSTIVVLPTGAGKTLIASTVAEHYLSTKSHLKVLFLVPTCLLVKQQANAIRKDSNKNIAEYMADIAPPTSFDILVSTPASFLNISASGHLLYQLTNFSLVIFDEVHHVVKRHPYRFIARRISMLTHCTNIPRILGLSASLTYSIESAKIKNNIDELCLALSLSGNCIFTVSTEELLADGYQANLKSPTIAQLPNDLTMSSYSNEISVLQSNGSNDTNENGVIKQNVEEICDVNLLNTNKVTDFLTSLEIPCKPNSVLQDFLHHIENNLFPIHPLSIEIMKIIRLIESKIVFLDNTFKTPIGSHGKHGKMKSWGDYAHKRTLNLLFPKELRTYYELIEHFYEALRLLINSRQLSLELAMNYLIMNQIIGITINNDYLTLLLNELLNLTQLWNYYLSNSNFQQLNHLRHILLQQYDQYSGENNNNDNNIKCIVFVEQRITTHILKYFIDNDIILSILFDTGILYSSSTAATSTLSVSSSMIAKNIEKFRQNELNLLFATSVAEEGLYLCLIKFNECLYFIFVWFSLCFFICML